MMAERDSNHLARQKALFRYTRALERSDFDVVAAVLNEAARDPILEGLILEVNDAYLAEMQIGPSKRRPSHNHNSREDTLLNTMPRPTAWQRRKQMAAYNRRWLFSLPLAAAAVLTVLFGLYLTLNAYFANLDSARPYDVEQRNIEIFQRYITAVWNDGDLTALDKLLAEDVVYHAPGRPDSRGVDSVAVHIISFRAAFPDVRFVIQDMSADGDRVWMRGLMTGTHTGLYVLPDGALVPPSNVALRLDTVVIARFEYGEIAELWTQSDLLGALIEMGGVGQLVLPNVECDTRLQQAGSLLAQAQAILESGDASLVLLLMDETAKLVTPCAQNLD